MQTRVSRSLFWGGGLALAAALFACSLRLTAQEPAEEITYVWVSVTLSTTANMGDGEEYSGRMTRAQYDEVVNRGRTTGFLTLEKVFWVDEDDEILFPVEIHPAHTDTAHINLKDVSVIIPIHQSVVDKAERVRGRI